MTEVELVRFATNGYTNKEIGKQLFWSEIQVKRKMQDVTESYRSLTGHRQLQKLCARLDLTRNE